VGKCQLIPNSFVPVDPEQGRATIPPKLIRQERIP
jgi:hypothetical protein